MQQDMLNSVHVDIDEEDDDVVFFSMQNVKNENREDSESSCQQPAEPESISQQQEGPQLPPSMLPALTDAPVDNELPCKTEEPNLLTTPEGEQDIPATEPSEAPEPKDDTSVKVIKRSASRLSAEKPPQDVSCRRTSVESVSLRPVGCSNTDQAPVVNGTMAPGLLADLRGGRAQGVRDYLARKLTQESQENQ
jgi:hypothetical protein